MRLPTLNTANEIAPAVERLLADSRRRRPTPMTSRERAVELGLGALLVAACIVLALAFDQRGFAVGPAVALTLSYAVAGRVRFDVGAGYIHPSQLVFVPMLFVLPAAAVPLLVAAGLALSRLPECISGRFHWDRLLTFASDWYAVGPALVFSVAGVTGPSWNDAPLYTAAFAAQVGTDVAATTLAEWIALQIPPRLQIAVLLRVYMVDALLTPVGLMAAFAADGAPYRALLVLPLVALIGTFAQEREAHVVNALQLSDAYRGTALLLGDVLEDKDAYTASHSLGVVSLSLAVADRMRLDPAARRRVEFGALLHDIGKIAVPVEILNKPAPLDADEWAVMKLHTIEGQQMLDRVGGVLGEVGRVVRSSHEHWDGSGYPDGLAGHHIPVESRIVACCDAFSAMTTTRSYRLAMSMAAARQELVRNSGTQFDPAVVDALLDVMREQSVHIRPDAVEAGVAAPAAT